MQTMQYALHMEHTAETKVKEKSTLHWCEESGTQKLTSDSYAKHFVSYFKKTKNLQQEMSEKSIV